MHWVPGDNTSHFTFYTVSYIARGCATYSYRSIYIPMLKPLPILLFPQYVSGAWIVTCVAMKLEGTHRQLLVVAPS
jgi:hypothetical protein